MHADDVRSAITGYVLAGGLSSRMGQDKARLVIDGEFLIARALRTLREVCSTTAILSGPPLQERDVVLARYGPLVPDTPLVPQSPVRCGPLGGIIAALANCRTPYALVVPVDQPSLPSRELLSLGESGLLRQASAACFAAGDRSEPLPLLLSIAMRDCLLQRAHDGDSRLLSTVQGCAGATPGGFHTVPVSPREAAQWFQNLNTPRDLLDWHAEAVASSNQSGSGASD